MSSVTASRLRAKRNKQKRIRKKAKQKAHISCKYCIHGIYAMSANVAYCKIKQKVIDVQKECNKFKPK